MKEENGYHMILPFYKFAHTYTHAHTYERKMVSSANGTPFSNCLKEEKKTTTSG